MESSTNLNIENKKMFSSWFSVSLRNVLYSCMDFYKSVYAYTQETTKNLPVLCMYHVVVSECLYLLGAPLVPLIWKENLGLQ